MSGELRLAVGVVALAALGAIAWVLRPDHPTEDPEPPVASRPAEPAAAQPPRFGAAPPRSTTPDVEAQPLAVEPVETTAVEEDSGPFDLAIGIVDPDGQPIARFLPELGFVPEAPERRHLLVLVTLDAPPPRLPDSVAPFYAQLGVGQFRFPNEGDVRTALPDIRGLVGFIHLPRRMAGWVTLALGPEVIATQPLRKEDDSVVFVTAVDDVKRCYGGLDLQLVDFLSRDPIIGHGVQLGMFTSLLENRQAPATDERGEAHLSDLRPGPTQLFLTSFGGQYEDRVLDVTIPKGGRLDLGAIELHRVRHVSGRVLSERGKPVAQAALALFADDPLVATSSVRWPLLAMSSSTDGSFQITRLGPRRFWLLASQQYSNGRWAAGALVPLDLTGGDIRELSVTVFPVAEVTFINPADRDTLNIHVRNQAVPHFDWWPEAPFLPSPAERKVPLVPGLYTVESGPLGRPPLTRVVDVGTEPLTVDLGE